MEYEIIKNAIRKLDFIRHVDNQKILEWIYKKARYPDYKLFKYLLFFVYALFFIVYFVSSLTGLMVLVISIFVDFSLKIFLINLMISLVLIYIAYVTLIPIRHRWFSGYSLVIFNLNRAIHSRSYKAMRLILPNLAIEIDRYYKIRFKKILTAYIYLIEGINLQSRYKDLKIFFRSVYKKLEMDYPLEVLDDITSLDNKIKNNKTYLNTFRYFEGAYNEKRDELFKDLIKIYEYKHKERVLTKIKLITTNTLKELFFKYFIFISLTLFLLILYIFKRDLFLTIWDKVLDKALK